MEYVALLGVIHLSLLLCGIAMFLYLLGLCNPSWEEPYPRACQFAYPHAREKRWFLQFVNQTALLRNWYTTSISQYVGARGTTGAKLMLLMTTCMGLSQLYIALYLWYASHYTSTVLTLYLVASVCVLLLGFCESALSWTIPPALPEMTDPHDIAVVQEYYALKQIVPMTAEEDETIKQWLSIVHTTVAILYIVLQFAATVVHGEHASTVVAGVGLGSFVLFCALQWLSGCNDAHLGRCAMARMPRCLRFFYYPQGSVANARVLKRISWTFLSIELLAFAGNVQRGGCECFNRGQCRDVSRPVVRVKVPRGKPNRTPNRRHR